MLETTKAKWRETGLVLVVAAALFLVGRCTAPSPSPVAAVVEASKAPEVVKEEKVEVALQTPQKTLKVYKEDVKKRLPIPTEAVPNANIQITDSSVIKPSERTVQVTQLVDIQTGETRTYTADLPSPWFSPEARGSLSLDAGFKQGNPTPVARVNLRVDALQTKVLHWGGTATAYTDGDWFVGAGVNYRW